MAVLRGAARDAFEATGRWDAHQEELTQTVLQEQEAEGKIRRGEAAHPNTIEDEEERKKHEPSPRLVRRWTKGPSITRRREERTAALRLLEPAKVVDETTVRLPGIGDLELEDPVPDGADIRSCQVVEITRQGTPSEKKRYRVHLQLGSPVPKTRRRRRMGIDLGVTHAVSTSDGKFFDRPDMSAALEEAERLVKHARKHCTRRVPGLGPSPCRGPGAEKEGPTHPGQLGTSRCPGVGGKRRASRHGEPQAPEHDCIRTRHLERPGVERQARAQPVFLPKGGWARWAGR